jgi:protein transport protein SEC24
LAVLGEGEEAVPVIDYATGPVRCGRCMAYVNPFWQFVDGGAGFVCSVCGMKGEVPVEYRCNLDANGMRRDRQDRPELCRGSVEYVVGKEFLVRPIHDPCYLFAVDVSYAAVMSGLTQAAVDAIRSSVEVMKEGTVKVGVMTYDASSMGSSHLELSP